MLLSMLLAAGLSMTPGSPSVGGCDFSATAPASRPVIIAPAAIAQSLHVLRQPSSPVRIVAADFTGTRIHSSDSVLEIEQVATVDIMNVGNDMLRDAAIRIEFRTADGVVGTNLRLRKPLAPGARVRLRARASRSRLTTWRENTPFDIVLSVERAAAGDCAYRLARQ